MIKFCSLFSGSSGNSTFISDGYTKVLVDCGTSGKKVIDALHGIGEDPSLLSGILITHEHVDHIKGVGILARKFNIPMFANQKTWEQIHPSIGDLNPEKMHTFESGESFCLGDIKVRPFSIPHDAADPVGFNFFIRDSKVTIATDIGHMNKTLLDYLLGSDIILLEANHDIEMLKIGPYPWGLKQRVLSNHGHLSNDMAGKTAAYLVENGTSRVILGHLSKDNNFPALAYQTVENIMREKGIKPGMDAILTVADREFTGAIIEI